MYACVRGNNGLSSYWDYYGLNYESLLFSFSVIPSQTAYDSYNDNMRIPPGDGNITFFSYSVIAVIIVQEKKIVRSMLSETK